MSQGKTEARPPIIEFVERDIEDRNASIANGRTMYTSVNFVRIRPHGDKNTVIEKNAEQWLEEISQPSHPFHREKTTRDAVPYYHKAYEDWKRGFEPVPFGTPLRQWPVLSPAEIKNLNNAGVYTVEDLASLPESGLARIGMGAQGYKKSASEWLNAASHSKTLIDELRKELELKDKEFAELKALVESLKTPVVAKKKTYKPRVKNVAEVTVSE